MNCNLSFIGLTETWLDESKEALHDISNYTCLHRYRQNSKGGGVTIAVRNGIAFKVRSDLESNCVLKRDYRYSDILKFKESLAEIQWDKILNEKEAQTASFSNILTHEYNRCFPIRKNSKKYCIKKPLLTSALKESIKIKNTLYVSRNRGDDPEQRIAHYKAYRNKLYHLLKAAERQHYQDLLIVHKSNLKKSWQVIKMIINKRKCSPTCSKCKYNGSVIEDGK